MFERRIKSRLKNQQDLGLYRDPPVIEDSKGKFVYTKGRKLLNLACNDYLGLASEPQLAEKVAEKFKKYGTSGSSSKLVSGNFKLIYEAEEAFADYFGYESALFYPSGFQCNLGLISTLFEKRDQVFFDKHIHSSLVKGLQFSGANYYGYKHNQNTHLAKRLQKEYHQQSGIITESLFSMDGDLLDIQGLSELKQKYDLLAIVDEAHAFGVLGNKGKGIARPVADVAVGTFGKALGLFGAFVLLPRDFREYLLNFSQPLIYTTTLPRAQGAAALEVLELIKKSDQKRDWLSKISREMKQQLAAEGFAVSGDAQILSIKIGAEDAATALSRELFKKGFFVFPARFPTVPLGQAILRLSLTAMHDRSDIGDFLNAVKKSCTKIP